MGGQEYRSDPSIVLAYSSLNRVSKKAIFLEPVESCDTNDNRQQIPLLRITRYDGGPARRPRRRAASLVIYYLCGSDVIKFLHRKPEEPQISAFHQIVDLHRKRFS